MAIVLPKFPNRRSSAAVSSAKQPAVNISLCRDDGRYEAGGRLTASWRIRRISLDELAGVEVSVLWHTQGKGDEDLGVHHFHRYDASDLLQLGLADQQSICCILPASPLSYQGHLLQIVWCVRVRMFMKDRREVVTELPFHLVAHPPQSPALEECRVDAVDGSSSRDGTRRLRPRFPVSWRTLRRRNTTSPTVS